MKVLVTGSRGFIGKNLMTVLRREDDIGIFEYNRGDTKEHLITRLSEVDVVFHLAGVNRTKDEKDFEQNVELAQFIYDYMPEFDPSPRLIFASSVQAELDNPYGRSKLAAEKIFEKLGSKAKIIRLPNVFGRWPFASSSTKMA